MSEEALPFEMTDDEETLSKPFIIRSTAAAADQQFMTVSNQNGPTPTEWKEELMFGDSLSFISDRIWLVDGMADDPTD